jgi:Ser/Thr protein kinase RdoA (MazF antagonist)
MLNHFRISANAIYPYSHNGKTFFLRFVPWDEKTENEMEKELGFIQYLSMKGLVVLEPALSKNGNYLLKKDTPWDEYLVCAFNRVAGIQLSKLDYNEEIIFCMGKTLGKLHKYSSEYNYVQKESCFEIIEDIERFIKNKLKDNREILMREIEEIKNIFQKLPRNNSNFGLIHGDFELDNIFYDEKTKLCSIIDFGSSKYHWYIMDIELTLNNFKEEYPQNIFENIKTLFINGYRTEYQINEEDLKLLPIFRRFDELCGYINLKDVTEETWDNEPEWMIGLRKKLNGIIMEIENYIANNDL